MGNKIKEIDIKNRTYRFFKDMINIKNLSLDKIKIDKKSYKSNLIYYIGYVKSKILDFCNMAIVARSVFHANFLKWAFL